MLVFGMIDWVHTYAGLSSVGPNTIPIFVEVIWLMSQLSETLEKNIDKLQS